MSASAAPFRLGMIGLGAIGGQVLAAIDQGALPNVSVPAILVRRPRPDSNRGPLVTHVPERFFAHGFDAVLEGAGHDSVLRYGERILDAGADLLLTSVGALADDGFRERLIEAARRNRRRLILPSAGIGALDILAGAAVGGLEDVEIVVRKQPEAWKGTPGESLVDLDSLTQPAVLYEGRVREGAKAYPKNVNISAAVALAGIGLDRTRLTIIADPGITTHVVEVHAKGAFGRFDFVEDVVPTADNPKTGVLVGMAVIKAIRQLTQPLVIGL